jgi:hypothetical protein
VVGGEVILSHQAPFHMAASSHFGPRSGQIISGNRHLPFLRRPYYFADVKRNHLTGGPIKFPYKFNILESVFLHF